MSDEQTNLIEAIQRNINQVVFGKPEVVRHVVIALLAGEHLLLEDVPGVGKTLLAKALARSLSAQFRRIQFTSDLLPSDIVGSNIFNSAQASFKFSPGPIFANVVLADEINRAPPRTQSALLEAMSESHVSVDGQTYDLPRPFIVVATQNPFDFEGTYPLPENQMDRFLLRIAVGYPVREAERQVLQSHRECEPVERLAPVVSGEQVLQLQGAVRRIRFEASVAEYLLDIVEATRRCDQLSVGVSPRGALSLYRAAQASALIDRRDFVVPDDVKRLAVPVLGHRVVARNRFQQGRDEVGDAIVARLVEEIPVPE